MFQDALGKSALHLAAACGHTSCFAKILEHCKSTQKDVLSAMQDHQGCTPLHWACYNGNFIIKTIYINNFEKKILELFCLQSYY